MSKKFSNKYSMIYIGIMCILFFIIYITLLLRGKMYMYLDIGADTYSMYWPRLAYAQNLLCDFKLWDMSLGLGTSTSTYISGDLINPFNWICLLFKKENINIGIFLSLVIKYILLSIYAYKYVEIKGVKDYTKIICSLMITFSGWFVGWGQHYNFANIYVLYIILLYYFECWLKSRKYIGVVVSTFILAIVSPYFCYIILLFMMFYYFIWVYYKYHDEHTGIKKMIIHAINTALVFIIGLGCAGFTFFPYAYDLLSSPRVGGKQLPTLALGDVKEYFTIFFRLFSNTILGINYDFLGYANFYESPFMYIGLLALILLPLYFSEKKLIKKYLVSVLFVLFTFVFVNVSAPLFNAFSTKTYRWTFLFVPILSLGVAEIFKIIDIYKIKVKLAIITMVYICSLLLYTMWFYLNYDNSEIIYKSCIFSIILFVAYLCAIIVPKDKKVTLKLLLVILTIDLGLNSYISVNDRNLISSTSKKSMDYFDGSQAAIGYINSLDSTFFRISKEYAQIDLNDSMLQNYNGEKLYSSMMSAETWKMVELFDLRGKNSNYLYGFDDKQILRNITCGKYKLSKTKNRYYGYKLIGEVEGIFIYENVNAIDFGIIYDQYVTSEQIEGLEAQDKQSVLLDNCIIDSDFCDSQLKNNIYQNNVETIEMKGEKLRDIVIAEDKQKIELKNKVNTPLIIEVDADNLIGEIQVFTNFSENQVSDIIPMSIERGTKCYYIDCLNVKSLYFKKNSGKINDVNIYTIDTGKIEEKIEKLRNSTMNITFFSDSYISGTTYCEEEKILFLPVPYNRNWKIYVNRESVKVYQANGGFMAIVLPEGVAEIEISYEMTSFKLGCIVSIISGLIFFIPIFGKKIKRLNATGSKQKAYNN